MNKRFKYIAIFCVFILVLSACGKSDKKDKSISSSIKNTLVTGGAIQNTLSLKNKVSLFLGKPGINGMNNGYVGTATFNFPYHITTDGKNLYVADYTQGIRKIDLSTQYVSTIVNRPSQITAITNNGKSVFAFDLMSQSILKIDIATEDVSILAGNGTAGATDGYGPSASFSYGEDMTFLGEYLYLVEGSSGKVRKINIHTGHVTTLTGITYGIPDGITTNGSKLYVADVGVSGIFEIDLSTGQSIEIHTATRLDSGITSDGKNLYFSDDAVLRKIDLSTNVVSDVAGSIAGFQDGIGTDVKFDNPHGMTTDGQKIYVTDTWNFVIRVVE